MKIPTAPGTRVPRRSLSIKLPQVTGMGFLARRRWAPVAIGACLLVSLLVPAVVLGQGTGISSQGALNELIAAAESSRLYANQTVTLAVAYGVPAASAQSHLAQGDSLLAQAESDASAGDTASGIQAAQASMSAFASAASAASVALLNAGFSLGTDYDAALSAVAEVNATVSVAAAAIAQVCGANSASVPSYSTFTEVCAQASTQISTARTDLAQAVTILVQTSGETQASGNLLQALVLIANARVQVQATVGIVSTLASYTYSHRAQDYADTVVAQLAAQANSTRAAETGLNSSFAQLQANYLSYARVQASSLRAVTGPASALAASITMVNVSAVDAGAASAESIADQVSSNLTALLALPGVSVLTGLVSDIRSCQSASSSFVQSAVAIVSGSNALQQTRLPSIQTYAAALQRNASDVQTSGEAYVSAYDTVVSDISASLGIPGVSGIYGALTALRVSGSVNGLDALLAQETSAVAAVQTDANLFTESVTAQSPSIALPQDILSETSADVGAALTFLNGSGSSATTRALASVLGVQQDAKYFVEKASLMTNDSAGAFGADAAALAIDGNNTIDATTTGAMVISAAQSYLNADIRSRASLVMAAQEELGAAMQLFSELEVSAGITAMAQASLDFQAAAATNAG